MMVLPRSESLQEFFRVSLKKLGYEQVAFTKPDSESGSELGSDFFESYYSKWLQDNKHGVMSYLEHQEPKRKDLRLVLSNLKSVVVAAYNYNPPNNPDQFEIAAYAVGKDYHKVLDKKKKQFYKFFKSQFPDEQIYITTDTGPVSDKWWAKRAGLGWMGKNTNIIHPKKGSYFFISVFLTSLDLEPDQELIDHCGSCSRCIDICPTQAITAPYQLDARLCISYLTIEYKGSIPVELRPKIGKHLFGCDDCQTVCPWNRFAEKSHEIKFQDAQGLLEKDLSEYLNLTEESFNELFAGSPIKRIAYENFIRNVLIVAANTQRLDLLEKVKELCDSNLAIISEHAKWAKNQILGLD